MQKTRSQKNLRQYQPSRKAPPLRKGKKGKPSKPVLSRSKSQKVLPMYRAFPPVQGVSPAFIADSRLPVIQQRQQLAQRRKSGRGRSSGYAPVQPSTIRRRLLYRSPEIQLTTGAGSKTMLYPVTINNAFVVDSNASAPYNATPQFAECADLYASYIVHGFSGSATFISVGSVPSGSETYVLFGNTAWGASPGGTVGLNVVQFSSDGPPGMQTQKVLAAGNSGTAKVVHTFKHTISKIMGESTKLPGYKSLVNAGPSLIAYMGLGMNALTASASNFWDISFELYMDVEFLDYIDTIISVRDNLRLGIIESPKCAACTFCSLKEFQECPCKQYEACGLCPWERACSLDYPIIDCPRKLIDIPVIPVRPQRKLSGLKQGQQQPQPYESDSVTRLKAVVKGQYQNQQDDPSRPLGQQQLQQYESDSPNTRLKSILKNQYQQQQQDDQSRSTRPLGAKEF